MIREDILDMLTTRADGEYFLPAYDDYCLSNLPSALLSLFGVKPATHALAQLLSEQIGKPQNILLFVIDGLGFNQWDLYADRSPFFSRLTERGLVVPITTVFPSTTAAALTSICTGLTPQEHGLLEWRVYYEEIDTMVLTLPFAPDDKSPADSLLTRGANPKLLLDKKTIFQELKAANVPTHILKRNLYAKSVYSKLAHDGGSTVPYITATDFAVNLRRVLSAKKKPSFTYAYWDALDAIGHVYGPHTESYINEMEDISHVWQNYIIDRLPPEVAKDTWLLVTADHGQVKQDIKRTIYLTDYPEIRELFALGPSGKTIYPWGSPRDLYLKIKPGMVETAIERLKKLLNGKAEIYHSQELLERGVFGRGTPVPTWNSRLGDITILPHDNETVWYEMIPGEKLQKLGGHGGMSADEMLIPLAIARLDTLRS